MNSFFKSYWAALIWAAFILILCGVPVDNLPNIDFWAINIEDKIAHIAVFALLSFFTTYGYIKHQNNKPRTKTLLLIVIICTLYGGLTELLQATVFPTRFASFGDLVADALGSILGTVFVFILKINPKV